MNVTLASHVGLAKLVNDPGVVLPVKQCRQRLRPSSSHPIFNTLGANDEHFRKNHGRNLRHQGGRRAGRRRSGCGRGIVRRIGGGGPAAATVDVAPILDKAVAAKGEKLAWRTSIVDLMKALDIDSSFAARKELAKELGYTGDSNDSASMNIWLHKQVMTKLAANGGKLPPDIKH